MDKRDAINTVSRLKDRVAECEKKLKWWTDRCPKCSETDYYRGKLDGLKDALVVAEVWLGVADDA